MGGHRAVRESDQTLTGRWRGGNEGEWRENTLKRVKRKRKQAKGNRYLKIERRERAWRGREVGSNSHLWVGGNSVGGAMI